MFGYVQGSNYIYGTHWEPERDGQGPKTMRLTPATVTERKRKRNVNVIIITSTFVKTKKSLSEIDIDQTL